MTEPDRCAICGHTDRRDLRWSLVHWRVAEPGMSYAHVGACADRAKCRARVQVAKKPWPLVETKDAA